MEFRILGPLEVWDGEREVSLTGPKPRALLAVLLLHANEVVPSDRLIDELWGQDSPEDAAAALRVNVSRLRKRLAPDVLKTVSPGYVLRVAPDELDLHRFERLVDEGRSLLARGLPSEAAERLRDALSTWRGPALADFAYESFAQAAITRLEETMLAAVELRVDADLQLGRHDELVGELEALIAEHPLRERLCAYLMTALYRSGRQAEALDVYERTRRRLDEELGLQPSRELQNLAGRIVRQDPGLQMSTGHVETPVAEPKRHPMSRTHVLAVAAVIAATAVGLTFALAFRPGSAATGSPADTRVGLIRMWNPGGVGGDDEQGFAPFVKGLQTAERAHGLTTEIVDLFPRRPLRGGFTEASAEDVERLSSRLESGDFDLVLWPLGLTGPSFYDVIKRHPRTRFVFLDYCCAGGLALGGASNVTAITLRAEQAAHLAGYLSGLMEARRSLPRHRRHAVSIVAGEPGFPQEWALVRGFSAGARRALPGVKVLVDYSYEYDSQAPCEKIANRQVDAGSGVVFAGAADCGLGALRAAGLRGVWGVGSSEDLSHLGPHILASATTRYDRLIELSVDWYLQNRLPSGGDVELGLADEAIALVGTSPDVPPGIRRKVAQEAARLQAQGVREEG